MADSSHDGKQSEDFFVRAMKGQTLQFGHFEPVAIVVFSHPQAVAYNNLIAA